MKDKPCNGMKNKNTWNVYHEMKSMDILYYKAKACNKGYSKDKASEKFMSFLKERGKEKTANGIPYTKTSVKLAMARMFREIK